MKLKSLILCGLLAITSLSCKNENTETTVAPEAVEETNTLKVTLTAVVKNNDTFQLFYKGDEPQFSEEKSFVVTVNGSDAPQDIVFNLPEDVIPEFIRIDMGMNKEQGEMIIQNFRMSYLDKHFEVKGTDFFTYFYGNEQMQKTDLQRAAITGVVSAEGVYDPMFASADALRKQIEVLVK